MLITIILLIILLPALAFKAHSLLLLTFERNHYRTIERNLNV